ncbi:MAG: DUF3333 domain-containing protein, partial [Erythrobacter sp.]|nr:DUF3333 domain-containing protein [Erythrobacter sp.]
MSDTLRPTRTPAFEARLRKRYAAERRFKAIGLGAILFSVAVLVFLLASMALSGVNGFKRAELTVPVDFTQAGISLNPALTEDREIMQSLERQGLPDVVQFAASEAVGDEAAAELNREAWRLVAEQVAADPALLRQQVEFSLPVSEKLANALAGDGSPDLQPLAQRLASEGVLADRFDLGFLQRADATDPQLAGIWGALKGSMLTMFVTLMLAFPIGVLAALYLEEYAPKNRWTDLIEVSIN